MPFKNVARSADLGLQHAYQRPLNVLDLSRLNDQLHGQHVHDVKNV